MKPAILSRHDFEHVKSTVEGVIAILKSKGIDSRHLTFGGEGPMIPITSGLQVGKATSVPTFSAEHHVTKLGRHDAYVVPQGGGFVLEAEKMRQVLLA